MKKGWIILVVVLLAAALVFTGCDMGAQQAAQSAEAPSPEASSAVSAPTPEASSAASASASQAASPDSSVSQDIAPVEPAVMPTVEPTVVANAQESTLQVSATGKVRVAPDIAYVYLGAQTTGTSASAAQEENNKIVNAFLDAVKKEGVAEEDIETSNIWMYPDYEDESKYTVESSYKVTVRDIEKVGAVIDAAVAAGANSNYSFSFDIQDRDAEYIKALGFAMQSVQQKAQEVAAAGSYSIVRPLSIVEQGSSNYYYEDAVPEMAAMDTAGGGSARSVISPGEIEVSASVTGTYVIE
ncbi:MAG: SIMPL domain-containing protein [Christensenellaceae bacterium]|jgi:uncharacterized protein YggE